MKIAATAHGLWMAQLHVSTAVTHRPIIITAAPSLINSWPRHTGIPTSVATKVVLGCSVLYYWASLVAQMVKTACNAGDQVWYLAWEDPLKNGMVTHSSTLAWRISWAENTCRACCPWPRFYPLPLQAPSHTKRLHTRDCRPDNWMGDRLIITWKMQIKVNTVCLSITVWKDVE